MDKQDLKQISDLMDQKFQENNKKLKKEIISGVNSRIEKTEESIMRETKKGFNEMDEKFAKVDDRFAKVDEKLAKADDRLKKIEANNNQIYRNICNYTDNELAELQIDMDKVKYIHIDKWGKLPYTGEISRKLAAKGLK